MRLDALRYQACLVYFHVVVLNFIQEARELEQNSRRVVLVEVDKLVLDQLSLLVCRRLDLLTQHALDPLLQLRVSCCKSFVSRLCFVFS